MKKVAFFDFCETLVSIQTGDLYLKTMAGKCGRNVFLKEIFRKLLCKIHFLSGPSNKLYVAKYINGIERGVGLRHAEEYLLEVLDDNLIQDVVELIKYHKSQGYHTCIVSGGYSDYIELFAKKYGVDTVIATDLDVSDGKYTGRLLGLDCMGGNKVKLVDKLIEFDPCDSYFYTDHISDVPLLDKVSNPVVVASPSADAEWAITRGYEVMRVVR